MGRFLTSNSIQIDNWYEALKYPESMGKKRFTHFDLKYGGSEELPFWRQIHASSSDIPAKSAALSRVSGYA